MEDEHSFSDFENRVQVRILSQQKLPITPEDALGSDKCTAVQQKVEQDTIVIHVHGGGFVATTSASHQNYLRLFAKNLPSAVIFSIDYRLAPQSRFPS
jgi:acetyl esterase/lipase